MIQAAKRFKASRTVKITGFSALMILLGACSSTPILQDDGEIPPPALSPSGDQAAAPIQIQTTTILPVAAPSVVQPVSKPASPVVSIAPSSKPASTVKYTAKKGDSLWKVSKMFDVSVSELAAYNNLDSKAGIRIGQVLQIPPGGLSEPKVIAPIQSSSPKSQVQGAAYTVKSGDSLWTVAKRNNISVKQLAGANNISSNSQIKIGQKLIIPPGKSAPAPSSARKPSAQSASVKPVAPAVSPSKTPVQAAKPAAVSQQQQTPAVVAATTATAPAEVKSEAVSASSSQPDSSNYLPHTVRDGDTWQAISDMYGVTVEELKKVNPSMANETQPKVGTIVNIPED